MSFDTRTLVWGKSRNRVRDWLFIIGGSILGIGSFVLLLRSENNFAFFALFGGPFLASTLNAYMRGGLLVSLIIGAPLAILAIAILASVGNMEGAIVPIGVSVLSPIVVLLGFVVGTVGRLVATLADRLVDTPH